MTKQGQRQTGQAASFKRPKLANIVLGDDSLTGNNGYISSPLASYGLDCFTFYVAYLIICIFFASLSAPFLLSYFLSFIRFGPSTPFVELAHASAKICICFISVRFDPIFACSHWFILLFTIQSAFASYNMISYILYTSPAPPGWVYNPAPSLFHLLFFLLRISNGITNTNIIFCMVYNAR